MKKTNYTTLTMRDRIRIATVLVIIIIISGIISHFLIGGETAKGIGGYVMNEMNWEKQTVNVMRANCGNNLFLEDNSTHYRLYCLKTETKGIKTITTRQYLPYKILKQ